MWRWQGPPQLHRALGAPSPDNLELLSVELSPGIHQLPRDCPVCLVAGNGPAGSEREPAALAPTRGFL